MVWGKLSLRVLIGTGLALAALALALGALEFAQARGTPPAAVCSPAGPGEVPGCPAGIIAYWPLDETSIGPYVDIIAGVNGTHTGVWPSPTTGQVDGAQTFNGSSTGVDVPSNPAFDWERSGSFSIEYWVRPDADGGCMGHNQVVIGRADPQPDRLYWWTGCFSDGKPAFYLIDNNGTQFSVAGNTAMTGGNWYHIVAVRDASANQLRMYVNGTQENLTSDAIYTTGFSSTASINMGWFNRSTGYHFDGTLDEVALYARALSLAEIQQHYNNGLEGLGYCASAGLTVEKTANPSSVSAGQAVTYTYAVENPGDTALSNVTIGDDKCSPVTLVGGDTSNPGQLDPGETWTYQCVMQVSADITNTVTVQASHEGGGMVSATDTAFVNVLGSQIAVEKTANRMIVAPGEVVTYSYAVTNPGDTLLSDVQLSDDRCSPVNLVGGDGNTNNQLDPGETWTYQCAMALNEETTNTATVTATGPGGTVNATDTLTVRIGVQHDIFLPLVMR